MELRKVAVKAALKWGERSRNKFSPLQSSWNSKVCRKVGSMSQFKKSRHAQSIWLSTKRLSRKILKTAFGTLKILLNRSSKSSKARMSNVSCLEIKVTFTWIRCPTNYLTCWFSLHRLPTRSETSILKRLKSIRLSLTSKWCETSLLAPQTSRN